MNHNTRPKNLISLRWWNVYFILKIILIMESSIKLSVLYNLAFIVFLLLPIGHARLKVFREIIAVGIGISLLYYDSYLPPIKNLLAQSRQLAHFELSYIFELLGRFISFDFLLLSAIVCFAFYLADKIFRVTTFVIAALLYLSFPIISAPTVNPAVAESKIKQSDYQAAGHAELMTPTLLDKADLANYRRQFFKSEQGKTSKLNTLSKNDLHKANFDILFLNVCSVAWDDLEYTGQLDHPLLAEFDIRFDNFNSATSYSGPAVIRLLRASCGQQQHNLLFEPPKQNQCLLFEQLNSLGFRSELLLNHNAEFDDLGEYIQKNTPKNTQPASLQGFSPYI